jgi:uncharacterized protein (DUF1501 family)
MSISRRVFLRTSATAIAAGAAAYTLPRRAAAGRSTNDHILVVLELNGGNDGLNTVIPVRDPLYAAARPTLAVPQSRALMLNDKVGLHPAMMGMWELFRKGRLAVIQGVGYPQATRSHFRSMEIWHRGNTSVEASGGWLGRYCRQALSQMRRITLPIVQYGAARGEMFSGCGMADEQPGPVVGSSEEMIQATGFDAAKATELVKAVLARGRRPKATYPQCRLGAGMALFAQMIVEDTGTKLYYISQGGFDTHARQAEGQAALLGAVSGAVGAFLTDLQAEGRDKDVLVAVFSEFGRRVRENSSAGTDHGAAGVMFFAGGSIRAGIYGDYPSLNDLDGGDLKHTVDFRDCYATVLESWLGVSAESILGRRAGRVPFV